jgi:HAD superfamily hydrolase (TIGR01484 family)
MPDIRLIVIDLDGTLLGNGNEFHLYNTFREKIQEFQIANNAAWVVCTGRPQSSFRHVFEPMRMIGVVPNFIIIRHAYIYGLTRFGYQPHFIWNLRIKRLVWMEQWKVSHVLEEWADMVFGNGRRAGSVRRTHSCLKMRFDKEETAKAAANVLEDKIKKYRNLRILRFLREVHIKVVPFTKGMAVSELSRRIGIGRENVLTIGDGHNDISMFDENVALYTGCPANAEPEVMQVIHVRNGHIAKGRSLAGVIEILDAHKSGNVCSDLPDGWKDPELRENPNHTHHKQHESHMIRNIICLLAVLYVLLAVFANFRMLPGSVAGLLLWPIRLAVRLMVKIF